MRVAFVVLFVSVCCVCRAQQIKEAEVPANVKAVAAKQSNGQPVTMWVLDKKRGKYIASIISTTAVAGIEISLDGKWIETTAGVAPDRMPAAVMRAATEEFPSYELDNFFYVTSPDKSPHYSVDASSDDEDLTLTIDPNGKILKKETR
ncbi:MAG TPA: PepSY-like domain-containing protein [Chryseolinea sp.]